MIPTDKAEIAAPVVPIDDYGTPAYESRWIREKLNLPADATTSNVQGLMHVVCAHAHGYEAYIAAYKCNDKQGEIARLTVEVAELRAELARLTPSPPVPQTEESAKAMRDAANYQFESSARE